MQNFCLEDKVVMVFNFIVMHSKAIKTTTRCGVDVALRGGSEILSYVETGPLTIELSKTFFMAHELSYISRNKDILSW